MWNFTASLMQKFVGLGPLKTFLKYIFSRISKDFLDKQPSIDFRNSILQLQQQLPLSANKINKSLLSASPYIMHSGSIRNLKITIPNLADISTKSIEVTASNILLIFKPNKEFQAKFEERMNEMKEEMKYYQDEPEVKVLDDTENSMDFFKQLLKQILTNIKVRVQNVCVMVYKNAPSMEKVAKPQYYSMLRVPLIVFERFSDMEIGKATEEFQKYRLEIPQISAHLLREDASLPEYLNVPCKKQDFPWNYPAVSHPSTILLVGTQDLSSPHRASIILRISKDVKHKLKELCVRVQIPNIEFMVQGYQIQILLNFTRQLLEFKVLWKHVMDNIRKRDMEQGHINIEESRDFQLPALTQQNSSGKKFLRGSTTNLDIFTSMAFALEEDNMGTATTGERKSLPIRKKGYLDSIMLENTKQVESLRREMMGFDKTVAPEIKEKILQDNKIEYSTVFTAKTQIGIVCLYVLKYNAFTTTQFQRCWLQYRSPKKFCKINYLIPSSYFFFKIKTITVDAKGKQNIIIKLNSAKLLDIRIKDSVIPRQQTMVFHSPLNQSSMFNAIPDIPNHSNLGRQLIKFQLQSDQHYCCNTILAISQKPPRISSKSNRHIMYNILSSEKNDEISDSAMTIKIVKEKKDLKVHASVKRVSVMLDMEIFKDLINIAYPMFIYRHLVETMNMKIQQLTQQPKRNNIMSIYFSNYDMTTMMKQDEKHANHKHDSKKHFTFQLQSFKCAFRQSPKQIFEDLIFKERRKTEDKQSFGDQCFCGYSGQAIGVEIEGLKSKICGKSNQTLAGEIALGIYTLSNEKHCKFNTLAVISKKGSTLPQIFSEKAHLDSIKLKKFIGIYIPKIEVSLTRQQPFQLLSTLSTSLSNLNNLLEYLGQLKCQMKKLFGQHQQKPKILPQDKPPLVIIAHVANANLYYMNFGAFLRHVVLFKESEKPIIIKGKQAMLISMGTKRVRLSDADGQRINQSSYDPEGYNMERFSCFANNISSDKIILYMAKSEELQIKNVDIKDRNYFILLNKEQFPVQMTITKSAPKQETQNKATSLKHTEGFCFTKAKKLESITEEEDHLTVIFNIKQPATIRSCEVKDFIDVIIDIKDIYDQAEKIKKQLKKQKFQRLKIQPSMKEQTKRLTFILKLKQLQLDSFPYFELHSGFDIMHNTRSSIVFEDVHFEMIKKQSHPSKNVDMFFVCNIYQIQLYFLYFLDCFTENNPITMLRDSLSDYGFTKILFSKNIAFKLNISKQNKKPKPPIEVQLTIDQIAYESSAKTTVYLQNHIGYVLKSMPKLKKSNHPTQQQPNQKPGMTEISSDCEFDEDQAEDLSTINESLQRKQRERTQQQSQFRNSPLQPTSKRLQNPTSQLLLRYLCIKRLSSTVYSGEDFSFLRTDPTKPFLHEPLAIELDNDNMIVGTTKLDLKQIQDTRVRFRFEDPDRNTHIKVEVEMVEVEFVKQEMVVGREKLGNMVAKVHMGSALCYLHRMGENRFIILRCPGKVTVIAEKDNNKVKVKCSPLPRISLGFTSKLKFLTHDRKSAQEFISKSFFSSKPTSVSSHSPRPQTIYDVFVFIPQFTIILDLQLVSVNFINSQQINVLQLFFHNTVSKYFEDDNKKLIKDWIKQVLAGNIGSVLGNSFVTLLTKGLWLMLGFVKQIVTLPGELIRVVIR